jgi:non-ribosomal peptide synthetase component E (peptide arylation enzyme)
VGWVNESSEGYMTETTRIGVKEPMPGVIYPSPERLRTYVAAGELPETTIVEALMDSFKVNADRFVLHTPEGSFTYRELDDITTRFAAALLALGLQPLDRVLFQLNNCKEVIFAIVGCLKAGLIPVCTLAAHREREIEFLGCHTDARAQIVQGDDAKFDFETFALSMQARIPTLRHIISVRGLVKAGVRRMEDMIDAWPLEVSRAAVGAVPRDPYQVAIFQLSGGTTNVPKVIPRMQNDYLLNALLTARWLGYRNTDVMFMPMPMVHNACMICFWLPTLLTGAAYSIAADMTPEAWGRALTQAPATWIGLIRALLPRLETVVDKKLASIDTVHSFWCPDAARTVREKFGRPAFAMFGMSEGMNMYTRAEDSVDVLDWAVGRPISRFDEARLVQPGTEIDVGPGEIGEFICRGPYTLAGYYNAPQRNGEAFTRDGFYKTGDLLTFREIDGERIFAFAGRTKDVISRGQEKINCEEVEIAVSTHPAVSGCAVVGMPDPVLGDRVCVYVVLKHGQPAPDVSAFAAHMRDLGMAKFKWPERVEIIDNLPLTKVGKLDKAPLRERIAQQVAAETSPKVTSHG